MPDSPSLQTSVRTALDTFVRAQQDTHTASDVLRAIRDASNLLYERQLLCDALDMDPLQQLHHAKDQVQRIQTLLSVTSCTRQVTLEGLCRIEAAVRILRDAHMDKAVDNHIELTFRYERRQRQRQTISDEGEQSGCHVVYYVEVAKDYGPRERLLIIELWAKGEGPSHDPPVPIEMEDDWEDMSDEGNSDDENDDNDVRQTIETEKELDMSDESEGGDASTAMVVDDPDGADKDKPDLDADGAMDRDRYAAYLDRNFLTDFIMWSGLQMDEYTVFMFLMTFPFYEHEWDLIGCVLESVFGEVDSDERDVDSGNDHSECSSL